jgi:error-prone DNA polymerase
MGVRGKLQREGLVVHVVAEELIDLSHLLQEMAVGRDLAPPLSRADHVAHPGHDPRDGGGYRSRDFR